MVAWTFPVKSNFGRLLHISSIREHESESMEYDFAGAFFGRKPFIKTPQFYKEIY
jgi:hypothetical protein